MKITIILYMISLSVYASRSWAQQESAWALSANPVSISYVPKGSAMEAGLSYLIHQARPDQSARIPDYVDPCPYSLYHSSVSLFDLSKPFFRILQTLPYPIDQISC